MQTRYKILILLFTVTLALGIVTLFQSSNDNDAVIRFRSLFTSHTIYGLQHTLASITARGSLWYGALALFAIIMIALVFRIARQRDSHGRREGFTATRAVNVESAKSPPTGPAPAKAGADSMLRAELKMMTDLLHEKDATITELENTVNGKQQLLQNRSKESDELKSKVNALTEQITDFRLAKERAENTLQQELKKTKVLQAKDSIITGLENNFTETQKLLQERGQEVDALKSQVNALMEQLTDFRLAKERAENMLQRELEKTKILQENSVIAEPEDGLSGQVHVLERELNEKQELLQTRSKELRAAKSKVSTLRERLSALGTAKNQTENVLQQQLKKKTELLQAKDTAIKELQESLSAKVHALKAQLEEKQKLLEGRDIDSAVLDSDEGSSLAEIGPGKKRAQSLLLQELQNRAELLEAKDAVVKELQERLNSTLHALENARSELDKIPKERDMALSDGLAKNGPAKEQGEGLLPRSDRKGMNSKLLELGAAKARAAASLPSDEAKSALEANDQSVFPTNKNEVLKTDDGPVEGPNQRGPNEGKN
jgi:hypothetical protein